MATQPDVTYGRLHTLLKRSEVADLLSQIASLEKKTFPKGEVYNFEPAILKKAHLKIYYVAITDNSKRKLVGYAVTARRGRPVTLDKICVASSHRRQCIAQSILNMIKYSSLQENSFTIELWVDEDRNAPRSLYIKNGFEEVQVVRDWYAPGRTGIKMALELSE